MKVEASVTRTINEEGNQVLTVEGVVLSDTQQGVLPAGKEYEATPNHFEVKGGALHFSFSVEAREPEVPVAVPKLPTELTPHEQEEEFLKQQLADPNLDAVSKQNIEEKLGIPTTPDSVSEGVGAETPKDAAV